MTKKQTDQQYAINKQNGVLLIELLIVIMIVGLLVAGAVKTWDTVIVQARFNKTAEEMQQLVYAIAGNPELVTEGRRTDFGYIGDIGAIPDSLQNLVVRPAYVADSCWRGPYIRGKFVEDSADYLSDAWDNKYIYDRDSLIIRSYTTGSNLTPQTWINKKIAKSDSILLRNTVSGFVKDLIGDPPQFNYDKIRVYITYPYYGSMLTIGFPPQNIDGFYSIPDVPQGNHRIFCIYALNPPDTTDFVEKYVCVYPGIENTVDFKLTVKF
jgi:type II secretory pathway pseudopilin PulG